MSATDPDSEEVLALIASERSPRPQAGRVRVADCVEVRLR